MKICSRCFLELPLILFGRDRRNSDGFKARCKECLRGESKKRDASRSWREERLTKGQISVARPELQSKNHFVYKLWDADINLLYVGISSTTLKKRFKVHKSTTPWWDEVFNISYEEFPDRVSALNEENRIIRTENPKYNVQGKTVGIEV
jgi:predicted GIY-YIG superfamily endonuclease